MKKNENENYLKSEEVQDILTSVPKWMIRWGSSIILLIVFSLIFLTYFIKYPDVISAEVTITSVVPPQRVFSLNTGKIDSIFVKEGDYVSENDILIILENSADFNDIILLNKLVDSTKLINGEVIVPNYGMVPMLDLGELTEKFINFENNYLSYRLNKESKLFNSDKSRATNHIQELRERYKSLLAQRKASRDKRILRKKNLERYKVLNFKGIVSDLEYEKIKLEYLDSEDHYNNVNLLISNWKEKLEEASRLEKNIRIENESDSIILLRKVQYSLNEIKNGIKDWELKYMVKSKIDGEISSLKYWSENQTIQEGEILLSVIPEDHNGLLAKIITPAFNSGKLKKGQKVFIELEKFPKSEYGTIIGSIETISEIPDSEGYYMINATLPNGLRTNYKKPLKLAYEMNGVAEIITEDLKLMERFYLNFKSLIKRK